MDNPAKNRLFPKGIKDWLTVQRNMPDFNFKQHEQIHAPKVLIYNSKKTLTTTVGSRLYPIRGGELVRVRINVQTAPSSTLTWTLLKNGVSVFTTNPTLSNESGSFPVVDDVVEYIPNNVIVDGDYFQFQVTATGGAGGPLIGVIEYLPADFY